MTHRRHSSRSDGEGPFLSVIIPAYDEEQRLPDSLQKVVTYLEQEDYGWEVVVADDGSRDRTPQIADEFAERCASVRLVRSEHGGKGHACKQGVLAARGQWLFLCDADLSMPIEELSKFVALSTQGYDILIGSREMPGAHRYGEPALRHLMGRVFNLVTRCAVRSINDTQCGFKLFSRDVARDLFSVQRISGWAFDVELLFVAQRRGHKIVEVPIEWYYGSRSKVSPVRDTLDMLCEVARVRVNGWRGLYGRADRGGPTS